MPTGLARVTDIFQGVCNCCDDGPIEMTGTITTGSGDVSSNNLACAKVGDTVTGECGHTGTITSGAGVNFTINGIEPAVIGSTVEGCLEGTIVTGRSDVTAG